MLTEREKLKYREKLLNLSDRELLDESFEQVDHANQVPTFSVHDQRAMFCYEEAERRKRPDLYKRGFDTAYEVAKGMPRLVHAKQLLEGAV